MLKNAVVTLGPVLGGVGSLSNGCSKKVPMPQAYPTEAQEKTGPEGWRQGLRKEGGAPVSLPKGHASMKGL